MPELHEGDTAPAFRSVAVSKEGERPVSLHDYTGKNAVVLYFYPKDDTPGCTSQACAFRDLSEEYGMAGAVILGVSPDDAASHADFAAKFHLPFPLVTDTDHAIAEAYGVWKQKTNYGRTYMGIERTTFVIGMDSRIARVFPRVQVDGHGDAVLTFVKGMADAPGG